MMSSTESNFKSESTLIDVAKELSDLLEADYEEMLYYMELLTKRTSLYMKKAEEDGLIVRGNDGRAIPLHPRMAISNLYRMAITKNPAVMERRAKVDDLIARLIAISEFR